MLVRVTGHVSRHSLSAGRPALVPMILSVAAFTRRLLVPLALLALLVPLALLLAVILLTRLTRLSLLVLLPVLLLVLIAHLSLLG